MTVAIDAGAARRLSTVTLPSSAPRRWSGRWIVRRLPKVLAHAVFLAAVFGAWQYSSGRIFDARVVSSPSAVAAQLRTWAGDGTLTRNVAVTVRALLGGFAIGVLSAQFVALVMSESKVLGRFLEPYIMALSAIPNTALAPIFIIWFGFGIAPKVVAGAMAAFFVVVVSAHTGLRDTDANLLELSRILKASRWMRLWKIKVPASLPFVMVGIRLALPRALIAVVVAEFLASSRGIGYLIVRSSNLLNTAGVLAATTVLTALAYGLTGLMLAIEQRTFRWRPQERR